MFAQFHAREESHPPDKFSSTVLLVASGEQPAQNVEVSGAKLE